MYTTIYIRIISYDEGRYLGGAHNISVFNFHYNSIKYKRIKL